MTTKIGIPTRRQIARERLAEQHPSPARLDWVGTDLDTVGQTTFEFVVNEDGDRFRVDVTVHANGEVDIV